MAIQRFLTGIRTRGNSYLYIIIRVKRKFRIQKQSSDVIEINSIGSQIKCYDKENRTKKIRKVMPNYMPGGKRIHDTVCRVNQ